jgi:hypothetical protein
MGEIDPDEAGYYLASDEQREFVRRQGYVKGLEIKAPSVVSLNAALAAAAVNEFAIYISGLRQIHPFTEFDILGVGRKIKSQWMTPVRVEKKPGCPVCANSGAGDQTGIEMRYARTGSD